MSLSHDHAAEVNATIVDNLRAENVRLQEQVGEAEAAVEKGGIVIYSGLSVPKRVLDEVQAEHAGRVADLIEQLAEQKRITDSLITVDIAGLRKAWKDAEADTRRWQTAKKESDDVIRRIVALVPRDPEREDIFDAIKRLVRNSEELRQTIMDERDQAQVVLSQKGVAEVERDALQERVEEAEQALTDTMRDVVEPLKMQRNGAESARDRYKMLLTDAATALHSDRNHKGRFWDCDLWGCSSAHAAIEKKP